MSNLINPILQIRIKSLMVSLAIFCFFTGCEDDIPCCPNCPMILEINPDRATAGSLLTIHGNNFGTALDPAKEGSVSIGGVAVQVVEILDQNNITVKVPDDAMSGEVVICALNKHPNYDNLLCSNFSPCEPNDTFALLVKPKANFSWNITNCRGIIEFENSSSPNSVARWDFGEPNSGDENISDQWEPSHAFKDFGTYLVNLQITDTITGLIIDTTQEVTLSKGITYDTVFGSLFLDEFAGNRVSDHFTSAYVQLANKNLVYLGRHTLGNQHGIQCYITDLKGTILFDQFISYGEDRPLISGVSASLNGGFLISGALIRPNGKLKGFLRKYRNDGTEAWRNGSEHLIDVHYSNPIETTSGEIFVMEYTEAGQLRSLVAFSETGSNLTPANECKLNYPNLLWGTELAKINDELLVFSTVPIADGRNELQVGLATINITACGLIQESKTIPIEGYASGITVDSNGDFVLTGRTSATFNGGRPSNGEDAFFAKYDQHLSELSPIQFFGGANDDDFSTYFEDQLSSGVSFLAGSSDSFNEGTVKGAYLIKFDQDQVVSTISKQLPDSKNLILRNMTNGLDKGYVVQGDVFLSGFYQFYFGRTDCDGKIFD